MSAVFVDYDNIYLSLRRKSEEAAKRFSKDAIGWLKQIENGGLITPTNGLSPDVPRRIVMNRCYGNPVPRRNTSDNSTDMSSFPFVRHHFLRAGFEVVDCPPLTAQLKNSSDIRMVMDLRDYLDHDTHFDEFVILSGDADFTPVLHRLRAHARRTVIYATEYTAAPYTAISDGEVREMDLIELLTQSRIGGSEATSAIDATTASAPSSRALAKMDGLGRYPSGQARRRDNPVSAAALIHEWETLLPSPTYASRTPSSLPTCSRMVTRSAIAWHGCSRSLSALTTGMPEAEASDVTQHRSDAGLRPRARRYGAGGVELPLGPRREARSALERSRSRMREPPA